ncbi:hypothetical protein KUCAC02_001917 [Chaenocephalus aceratus]|uniref:Uncharacterized protein n=1 Tax=Chaenocephalus aceratus TaxID=36190 RepID=A0ACB9XS49_CHAAC|nr:hypothetical protein KUCAC02_001917 [Chaenocephalus aceratus]
MASFNADAVPWYSGKEQFSKGLGWLSGAEEIDKQVERLKSPAAPEAGVTLLRARADQYTAHGRAAGWMDEWAGRT